MVAFDSYTALEIKSYKKIKKNPATAGFTYLTRDIKRYFVTDWRKMNSVLLRAISFVGQVWQLLPEAAIFSAETFLAAPNINKLPAATSTAKMIRKYGFGFITVV